MSDLEWFWIGIPLAIPENMSQPHRVRIDLNTLSIGDEAKFRAAAQESGLSLSAWICIAGEWYAKEQSLRKKVPR